MNITVKSSLCGCTRAASDACARREPEEARYTGCASASITPTVYRWADLNEMRRDMHNAHTILWEPRHLLKVSPSTEGTVRKPPSNGRIEKVKNLNSYHKLFPFLDHTLAFLS